MTATQTLKIYQILQKHFKSEEDAGIVVKEIEDIVENKIEAKTDKLSTKEDILNFRIEMEKRFNQMIIWTVSTGIAVVGLILAFLKF